MTAYIQDIAAHDGQAVTPQGLAAQPPIERQDSLPDAARRHRVHPVHHDEAGGRRGGVQGRPITSRRKRSIIVDGTVRADTRAPGGFEVDVTALEVVSESQNYPISPKEHGVDFLMDRRHLWIRSPRQQAILRDPPRSDQRGPRVLQRAAASSSPTRRSSRRPRAKVRPRSFRSSTSTTKPPT